MSQLCTRDNPDQKAPGGHVFTIDNPAHLNECDNCHLRASQDSQPRYNGAVQVQVFGSRW